MASIERERVPTPRPITAREIPLIDRVEEMKLLKETVDRTIQGEGGLVFLYGEAGIGKTRLARELRAYAYSRGMQVLYGRCPSLFRTDGAPPYILWSEVIRDYMDNSSMEQLYRVIGFYPAEVAKLVPEIVQKLRAIPQSFPISPEQEQNRLFEAVSQFITNISREAPLLVVIDDLQWTDTSSLLLLHYLARGVQKTPLLLLGAYRSTDIDAKHPLSPVLTELNRERVSQSVSLKRMSLDDVSEMIKQILEQDDIPTSFCNMVYEKTRGNPFFAEEVMKSLKEEEVVYREENKWKIKEVSRIELPETVRVVIKTRISRLDVEGQRVLTMASVVGNDFTLDALKEVMGFNEVDLRKILDELLRTGLLKHRVVRGEDVCSFSDVIMRDVVYEEVGTFERKKLHSSVGTALEKVYAGTVDEHFGELAYHFLEGGDKDKALDYFLKAGEKAQKIHANHEAASYFKSAIALLEEKKGELQERSRVLEGLGDIKKLVGELDECMKCWNDALSLRRQLNEREGEARLHRKIASALFEMGKLEKAKECLSEALKILEMIPESIELVRVYDDWGSGLWAAGDMREALSWTEKALGLAERLKDFEGIARSYFLLGTVVGTIGDLRKCVEYLENALKIALEKGYMEIALGAYNNFAFLVPAEEYERRFEYLDRGLELAKKVGDVNWQSWLGEGLAQMYMAMGDVNKAVVLIEESVALDRKSGNIFHLPHSLGVLGDFYIVLGEWDKAEELAQEVHKVSQELKHFQTDGASYHGLGRVAFDKGEYSKAKGFFEKMYEAYEKAGAKKYTMGVLQWLIRAHIELGEFVEAENQLDTLQKFALEAQDKLLIAVADALKATLFRAQKKWQNSIALFEKSTQEFEALDARRWRVYSFARFALCEHARTYLERGQEGDREKARDLLSQALEMFEKMGAKKDVEKTLKMMEVSQPPKIQTQEKTVSPASYVCDEVRCNVIAAPRELKVGESLELEIELTNTRKEGTILLTKIAEVVPEGFAIVKKPEFYRMEDNCLNMKEKRLDPQETEIVKLVLTPKVQGTFQVKPKILYIDIDGKEKTLEPKPASITVKELGIKGWLKGER